MKLIESLPSKTSYGVDSISNTLLKDLKNELVIPLTILINKSLEKGIFPDRMKGALVIPLFKSNERFLVTNYRPISLLLTISKVFEKVVHKGIHTFMERNNIFFNGQYGFRENRSTSDAINDYVGHAIKKVKKVNFLAVS